MYRPAVASIARVQPDVADQGESLSPMKPVIRALPSMSVRLGAYMGIARHCDDGSPVSEQYSDIVILPRIGAQSAESFRNYVRM